MVKWLQNWFLWPRYWLKLFTQSFFIYSSSLIICWSLGDEPNLIIHNWHYIIFTDINIIFIEVCTLPWYAEFHIHGIISTMFLVGEAYPTVFGATTVWLVIIKPKITVRVGEGGQVGEMSDKYLMKKLVLRSYWKLCGKHLSSTGAVRLSRWGLRHPQRACVPS